MIDTAQPSPTPEYVLVTTYWFRVLKDEADVTGYQVNTELKNLGHGTADITGALSP